MMKYLGGKSKYYKFIFYMYFIRIPWNKFKKNVSLPVTFHTRLVCSFLHSMLKLSWFEFGAGWVFFFRLEMLHMYMYICIWVR